MACSWSLLGRTPYFCLKVREKFELIKCAFLIFNLSNIKTLRPKANIALGLFTIQGQPLSLNLSSRNLGHHTIPQRKYKKARKIRLHQKCRLCIPMICMTNFPRQTFYLLELTPECLQFCSQVQNIFSREPPQSHFHSCLTQQLKNY